MRLEPEECKAECDVLEEKIAYLFISQNADCQKKRAKLRAP